MLWIGPRLGAVERACMRSVLRQGHRITLWTYGRVDGVPEWVETADAADVLPEAQIVCHKDGSPSLFSNRFRYELQRRGAGAWLDADIYLVRPLPETPLLLAREDEYWINPAVLRLPQDSPLLAPLLACFEERTVPFWLPWRARMAAHWRLWRTGRSGLGLMPWGVAGPKALTALSRAHGLAAATCAPEVFNPVHWEEAEWILCPGRRLEDRIGTATVGVHLWNEKIRCFKNSVAPPGSVLERLQREGA
jgi:hypothetical protein